MFAPIQVKFKRTVGVNFDRESYDCPDDVKNSFPNLTKSIKYEWNENVACFFYEEESDEDCERMCNHVATLLKGIQPLNRPLHADIILSPVKKYYPNGKMFGPENVNTGYSSNKIVVYRKEEWFKVFIHECFHFFNFEKKLHDRKLDARILNIFNVTSEVNLYESYCEFMARTLNCKVISAYAKLPFEQLLQQERKHSNHHMVNVLHHMGLTYNDIINKASGFKENTNVLAYVVLTNILMNNNYSSDYFELQDGNEYVSFIETHYKNKDFLRLVERTRPQVTTTMSFQNIDLYKDWR
jgi:hypothetical protein